MRCIEPFKNETVAVGDEAIAYIHEVVRAFLSHLFLAIYLALLCIGISLGGGD